MVSAQTHENTRQNITLSHTAQLPQPLSLAQAVETAIRENRSLLAVELDRGLQLAELKLAEAEFFPKYSLTGQATRDIATLSQTSTQVGLISSLNLGTGAQINLSINKNENSDPAYHANLVTRIQLIQPLLKGNMSASRLPLHKARLTEAIGQLSQQQLIHDTIAAVVFAYHEAAQADSQVEFALQSLQRILEVKAVNQALFQSGRLAQRDLLQTDIDLSQAELALEEARNTSLQVKRFFLQLLGQPGIHFPPEALHLSSQLSSDIPTPATAAEALAIAHSHRKDFKLAKLALEIAAVDVKQAKNSRLSQLDLVAGAERFSNSSQPHDSEYYVGLQLNIPLNDNTSKIQLSYAEVTLQKMTWAMIDLKQDIKNQVVDALRNLQFAERQALLAQKAFSFSKQNLDSEMEKLKAGRTSTFQLSVIQSDLLQAQVALSTAQLAIPQAKVRLQIATGQIGAHWNLLNEEGLSP